MVASAPLRPSSSKKRYAFSTLSAVASAMCLPAIFTPRASVRMRLPPQAEQGRWERKRW